MQQIIRFTCSGFLGFFITLVLFFGMMKLLGSGYKVSNSDSLNFNISYVKAEVDTKERKRLKKKPPEMKKSSQPPAAPRLNVVQSDHAMINLPSNFNNGKNLNILNKIDLPGFNMDVGGANIDSQGGFKAGIPPIYPPKALLKNTEGWVKVLISIDEFGSVSAVSVLDSNPARLFDEAALKAVRKWSYYEKKVNDEPVPYQVTQTVEFNIETIIIED
jgi:protein TonB